MEVIPAKEYMFPLVKKEQVAKDAYAFFFDRSQFPDFNYIPGNYLRMTLDVPNVDDRGNTRLFSITSSPLNKQFLTTTTRIIQSTFKKTLVDLPSGTPVKFFAPMGRFLLDESDTRPHIFLAGGIGITPYLSMLRYAKDKSITIPMTLFVSFSTQDEVVFYDELTGVSNERPNIKIVYTITHTENLPGDWKGETGRISSDMIQKHAPDFAKSLVYISGPPAMVDGMEKIVQEMAVPPEQVKTEQFAGY